jgi:hypothetical protein
MSDNRCHTYDHLTRSPDPGFERLPAHFRVWTCALHHKVINEALMMPVLPSGLAGFPLRHDKEDGRRGTRNMHNRFSARIMLRKEGRFDK